MTWRHPSRLLIIRWLTWAWTPACGANVTIAEYEAGHMMYLHEQSLAKLKSDAAAFIAGD